MPRHGTLAAAGQPDTAATEIGAAPGIVEQVLQRDVPTAVDVAALVEVDSKKDRADDVQALVDTQETGAQLAPGVLGQAYHLIQDGLEFDLKHLLDRSPVIEKHHRLVDYPVPACIHFSFTPHTPQARTAPNTPGFQAGATSRRAAFPHSSLIMDGTL
jgi:hypothetical protein